jgi:hypothetical protein
VEDEEVLRSGGRGNCEDEGAGWDSEGRRSADLIQLELKVIFIIIGDAMLIIIDTYTYAEKSPW